jgi:hypothetical protein
MADVDLFALYERAAESVFRLEAQARYAVPAESARMQAFEEGRPLPADPAVSRTLDVIGALAAAGRRVHRVHVLDLPLTPYLRYELTVYAENVGAGEEIRIADRAWHPQLAELTEDFVLLDGDTDDPAVVWMRYDSGGRITGREHSTRAGDVSRCRLERDVAVAHSVPLEEFTAAADIG